MVYVEAVKGIIRCFETMSGLKVNLKKSQMVGVRVDDTRITPLLNCGRCGLRSFLMTYICLPLGANPISKLIWNSVISMFLKKSTWKRRYYLLGYESH